MKIAILIISLCFQVFSSLKQPFYSSEQEISGRLELEARKSLEKAYQCYKGPKQEILISLKDHAHLVRLLQKWNEHDTPIQEYTICKEDFIKYALVYERIYKQNK